MGKLRKPLAICLGITVYLVGCWYIGQRLHPDTEGVEQGQSVQAEQQEMPASADDTAADENRIDLDKVEYEGSVATEDNPWGITAGTIDLEDRGKSIFLTPNTAVVLDNVGQTEELSFSYEIHPWMKENSDGAGLVIWLMAAEGSIIKEEEITVNASDDIKEFKLDLTQYEDATRIKMLCNNGFNHNDSGDWVVLSAF